MDTKAVIRFWHIDHDEKGFESLETPICQREIDYHNASDVSVAISTIPVALPVEADTNYVEIEQYDGKFFPKRIAYANLIEDDNQAWHVCLLDRNRTGFGKNIDVDILAGSIASVATILAAMLVVSDQSQVAKG